jgi:hypothetical protein
LYNAEEQRYKSMKYCRSGKSGVRLPMISLGLWHNFGGVDTFENGRAMMRRAFDLGITHFDLANRESRARPGAGGNGSARIGESPAQTTIMGSDDFHRLDLRLPGSTC